MSMIHHVLGFQTMYCALIYWNMPVVFGAAMCWLEISTIFVALRWLMFFHGVMGGSWLQSLNTFICAFTFIFLRTVFQIYAVAVNAIPWCYWTFVEEVGRGLFYKVLIFEFFLAVAINIVFNTYWSWLIIYQCMRVFSRDAKNQGFADGVKEAKEEPGANKPKHVELAEIEVDRTTDA